MAGRSRSDMLLDAIATNWSFGEGGIRMLGENQNYADLTDAGGISPSVLHQEMYGRNDSILNYRNFLDWLFATFRTDEANFRRSLIAHLNLRPGDKVLITGCGLGEDVELCCEEVGATGIVHGQDLSRVFVEFASAKTERENVVFTVSNALKLPYKDDYFDAVYHFGGINLFGDIQRGISEMVRVCRTGGRIVFGDESVAPHLRRTDYGRMLIKNNRLWEAHLPLAELPPCASDICVRYVLGNCFYLISFTKFAGLPAIDIDVPHRGYRGGSVRTRFFGELEGIDPTLKEMIYAHAKESGTSVSAVLTILVSEHLAAANQRPSEVPRTDTLHHRPKRRRPRKSA